jgi:N-acylneuraminate cytidylyltransferase
MRILAIIPARAGSKGLPHKNIRLLAGHPLLAWSIAAAKLSRRINRVIVSTDSREYADIANTYGAETPFLRPEHLAQDHSRDIGFILHALDWLKNNEGRLPDFLVHLRPTGPNRIAAVIDEAVAFISRDKDASSLCSAHAVEYPPCKCFKLNPDDTFSGYMGEEYVNLPRQECIPAYQPNGHVDVLNVKSIVSTGSLHGPRRLAFLAPDPGDIDGKEDFDKLGMSLASSKSELAYYLNGFNSFTAR